MVNRINAQQQDSLWQGAGLGGLVGMFLGRPILGALGGLAYKLFTTDGLKESVGKIVGDFANSEDPLGSLGSVLGGRQKTEGSEGAKSEASSGERKSGFPSWAKWGLGIFAGLTALNTVQDFIAPMFGMPGYGMGFPFGGGFASGYPFNMMNPNMPLPFTSLFPYY
jgi:hypothetical protein